MSSGEVREAAKLFEGETWDKRLATIINRMKVANSLGLTMTVSSETCGDLAALLTIMSASLDFEEKSLDLPGFEKAVGDFVRYCEVRRGKN